MHVLFFDKLAPCPTPMFDESKYIHDCYIDCINNE